MQKKLKELIDSGRLSDESYDYELFEALDLHQGHGRHCLDELFYSIGCKDADLEDEFLVMVYLISIR